MERSKRILGAFFLSEKDFIRSVPPILIPLRSLWSTMAEKPAQASTDVSSAPTTQEPCIATPERDRDSTVSDTYRLKSELVSKAFSEMGIGRYQWQLLLVTGFG